MPYHVGARGSYGCSGYPAVKDDGTVMGCHQTQAEAEAQIYAINQSEGNIDKVDKYSISENAPGCSGFAVIDEDGEIDGCFETRAAAQQYIDAERADDMDDENDMDMMAKAAVSEGDYAMVGKGDKAIVGQVVHVMTEGMLGVPGADKTLEATADNPAILIRIFEQDDEGWWEPTDYFYGERMAMFVRIDPLQLEPTIMEMNKAEGFTPTAGMKAAARRALRWKEEGKATGAGTPVGWGRATDIVAGRSMSLSVVRRMFSFFSRHEVDKKGKDFYNTSNPSNGRIMWDAWGGDAGFTWSRGIVERNRDKALFADFGKDYTKAERLVEFGKGYGKDEMYKAVRVGSMVSWNSSGGRATGRVRRIITSGTYNVPGTSVSLNASQDDPVAVITLYRDGKATDITVGHKVKTLRMA